MREDDFDFQFFNLVFVFDRFFIEVSSMGEAFLFYSLICMIKRNDKCVGGGDIIYRLGK